MDNASTTIEASHRVFPSKPDKNYVERIRYWKAQGLSQAEAEKEAANPTRRRRRLYAVRHNSAGKPAKSVLSHPAVNLEPENLPRSAYGKPCQNLELDNPITETGNLEATSCYASSSLYSFRRGLTDTSLPILNSAPNLQFGKMPDSLFNSNLNLQSEKCLGRPCSQKFQQTICTFKAPDPGDEEFKLLRTKKHELVALAVFNPKQPIYITNPTQAKDWQRGSTGPDNAPMDQSLFWARQIVCLSGLVVCSGALIKYGAEAGGQSPEAWFWAALIVVSSSILIARPMLWGSLKSWLQKLIGFALLGIGYATMHASIEMTKQQSVAMVVSGSAEVQEIRAKIADLNTQLDPTRAAISRLDPIQYRTLISRMQAAAKPLEDDLSATRAALITAQKKAARAEGAGNLSRLALVEWLRRLMLEPLNILCMHGFLESLPAAIKKLRNPKARLVQCFV